MTLRTILCLALMCAPLAAIEPTEVLIVCNTKAEGSLEIAEHYAAMRGVPKDRILKITASTEEEITREEFNRDIWPAVSAFVKKHPQILAIVPCRGVPLKIKELNTTDDDHKDLSRFIPTRDFASVDGELALARQEKLEIQGAIENPYLNKDEPLTTAIGILAVCRLDGPTVEIAKGLIDKAIIAELLVPEGENYLDTGTNNPNYKQRDGEMAKIADVFKEAGIALNHDTSPEVQDLSTYRDPLHYFGWYAGGQKPAGVVRFRTGAVAAHLHSFSAATVRNPNAHWVAPLLSWGCTASYGTVYEPLTVGFPYENIFYHRLLKGYTFGEAGQMANHLLSWQAVFCGDPLYRPYARNWRERKDVNRAALAALLSSGGKSGGDAVDEKDKALLQACFKMLQGRVDGLLRLQRTDPRTATREFMDLLFFVRGFDIEAVLMERLAPFNAELKRQWADIKAALKARPAETAAYEEVLATWQGLPIYGELESYKEELAKTQEKLAEALVKKAESARKSKRFLDAYRQGRQAMRLKFAPSAATGKALCESIEADADQKKRLLEAAGKELSRMKTQAKKNLDRGAAAKAKEDLAGVPDEFPDCEERKAAVELLKQVEAKLPKPK